MDLIAIICSPWGYVPHIYLCSHYYTAIGILFFYYESEEEELDLLFLTRYFFSTYKLSEFLNPFAIVFLVSSFIILHLVDVNIITFPLLAIWLTLRMLSFNPLTNRTLTTSVFFISTSTLSLPNTFADVPFPRIILPLLLLRKMIFPLFQNMWWGNQLYMYHLSSSSNNHREMPHLTYSSYFYLAWGVLGDPTMFLTFYVICCLNEFIVLFPHSFSTCKNLLQV